MYSFLEYRTRHVMTRDVVTLDPDALLAEAEALFEKHDFNTLPVVDGAGDLQGVLTKLDALRGFAFSTGSVIPRYEEVMARPVRDFMSPDPETVDPELPLTRVLERMVATGHKGLPVAEGARLVGVIAREDVLRALRRAVEGKGPED
jgi:CBS domain-containing protein